MDKYNKIKDFLIELDYDVMYHEERKEHFFEAFIDNEFRTIWLTDFILSDKELLGMYMLGFRDELDNKFVEPTHKSSLLNKAYYLGKDHAIIGDDVSSIDLLGNDDIIKIIRTREKWVKKK